MGDGIQRHAAGGATAGGIKARPDGSEVTAKFEFVVEVTPDELDGGFVVKCLNLPGCVSEGETVDEALDNLADAIAGVMITRFEERDREIERLKQGLWNCAGAAGTDLDGDPTPRHLAYPDIVDFALNAVRELRRDYDEGLGEAALVAPAVTTGLEMNTNPEGDENLD